MKTRFLWFGGLSLLLQTAVAGVAAAAPFSDSTRVNVLRQFGISGTTNLVTESYSFSPSIVGGFSVDPGNNSSGWTFQSGAPEFGLGETVQEKFTLPGPRTISSISFEKAGFADNGITFEGYDLTNNWVALGSLTSAQLGNSTVSFAPVTVTQLRYTVAGPTTGDTYFYMKNVEAFLSTGQTIDRTASGYNILRDNPSIVSITSSPSSSVWAPVGGFGAAALTNGDHTDNVAAQVLGSGGGDRAYVLYTFAASERLGMGHLGFYHGQDWSNWELYTSNALSAPALTGNTISALTAAGWQLQYSQVPGSGPSTTFTFAHPDLYKYALLVWNVQGGSATEFELFGVPEPSSISLVALGGTALLVRYRRRRSSNIKAS